MPTHKGIRQSVCLPVMKTLLRHLWINGGRNWYYGLFVDPLMDDLNAFINEVNKKVTDG